MASTISGLKSRLPREMPARMDTEMFRRGMLGFKSRKLKLDDSKVMDKVGLDTRKRKNDTSEEVYLSPPEESSAQLPEKLALLESFYEGVEAAVSLMGIRRQPCTFQAVCATVEATTRRRFLQKHLAQIKQILPEVVDLEYVKLYDDESSTRKWELKIALLPISAEESVQTREAKCTAKKPKIESVQRRRVFHARLAKFAATHPEDEEIPVHPMPERPFCGNSTLKSRSTGMPAAMTCIPMGINTTSHRVEVAKSPPGPPHYSGSSSPDFLLKTENRLGSFIRGMKTKPRESADVSDVLGSILPMPINRTSHRDVHNVAKKSLGTPHIQPSFKPFFSRSDIDTPSQELSRLSCRHDSSQEGFEIVAEVEPQTPLKVTRTYGIALRPTLTGFETHDSHSRHYSVAKSRCSTSNSSMSLAQPDPRLPVGTALEPFVTKDASISWEPQVPSHVFNAAEQCSPEEEVPAFLKTPVKSTIRARPFKSPAPVTPSRQIMPCTPCNNERGGNSNYISYYVGEVEAASPEGSKSPAATPVKGGSTIRSLNFTTPKTPSFCKTSGVPGSPCPLTPGLATPSTPGLPTSVFGLRAWRSASKEPTKLNLRPLFDRTGGNDESAASGLAQSRSETPSPAKPMALPTEASKADILMIQGLPSELVNSVFKEELRVAEENRSDVVALRRHRQMKAGLPHLFDQLRMIFQSSNKSVFPYKELLSKLVSSNTEMTDQTEVEERLKLLMGLAPEWISAKPSLTGDTLYRIDKKANVIGVRKRLSAI